MEGAYSALLLVLGLTPIGVYAQCPEFDVIEPGSDLWDESYHSIGDTEARPIGFKRGIVYYDSPQLNTCTNITGVQGRTVEIVFETIPSSTLCNQPWANMRGDSKLSKQLQNVLSEESSPKFMVTRQLTEICAKLRLCGLTKSNVEEEICDSTGRYTDCMLVNDDAFQVQFSSSPGQGGSQSDVTFWYRLAKSPTFDLDGHWCADRDNRYPQDLLALPSNAPIPDADDDDDDNGAVATSIVSAPVLSMLAWIALKLW